MDIQTLSQQLTAFLAPFLPYLLKMGEKAAEEAAKKLGAEAWEAAKALWGKLKPKVEAKPAAQDLAAHPALRLQLRKLLAEDEALAREVQPLVTIISRVETGDALPEGPHGLGECSGGHGGRALCALGVG